MRLSQAEQKIALPVFLRRNNGMLSSIHVFCKEPNKQIFACSTLKLIKIVIVIEIKFIHNRNIPGFPL